jgi:CRP/FNR family transcriptional regulator
MKGLSHQNTCEKCAFNCLKDILSAEDMLLIENNKSEMSLSTGETIIRQGTFVSQICYLKSGIVKKVLEGKNDRNTIVKLVDDKNFIAFPVLGNAGQYPFSVIAVKHCEVCFIKKDILYSIFKKNENAHAFILDWFANDYVYLYNKIATISTRNSHGKLATVLLYLSNGNFTSDVLNAISRKELAELASTSKESTNKILQQLNHDGLIEINNDKIIIKRRDLLAHLSTVG